MSKSNSEKPKPDYLPTREELIQSARDLVPTLKKRAKATEDRRDLPDETLVDLKASGIHKIFTPKRYGGFEMDWGSHVDVSRELGKACGSTSWICSVVFCNTWVLGRFPPECQEEFWANQPDAVVATAFAGGGKLQKVDGGYIVNGYWKFSSGINHADGVVIAAADPDYDHTPGQVPPFRMALLQPGDYEIEDAWYSEGLKGTGSNNFRVTERFIPEHRTMLSTTDDGAPPPGAALHDSYIYRVDFTSHFFTFVAGPFLGTAAGALEEYCAITKKRTGQMFGESVAEQVPVQVKVGESVAEINAANAVVDNMCNWLHDLGSGGKPLPPMGALTIRRNLAFASRLCLDAASRLSGMMGVSGQTGRNPVQRHFRDCRTISTHGGIQWEASMAPTGQVMLGVSPEPS